MIAIHIVDVKIKGVVICKRNIVALSLLSSQKFIDQVSSGPVNETVLTNLKSTHIG